MKTASRQYFETRAEAEKFLERAGYHRPLNKTDYWFVPGGVYRADVRFNADGFFIVYG